ncbi:aminopeptidase [Haematobacter massiliensis]|nr:AbrB family transcriptional regulator [Haematobacter massiliensis]OWJ71705.1 aminopeptidase [Haematobacter massiliensis]OWJ88142.1 aminopeptidase [Haematobacter massiliensis]
MTMPTTRLTLRLLARLGSVLLVTLAAAQVARWGGMPLPWMLGPLIAAATLAMSRPAGHWLVPLFPNNIRSICVGVVGLMIGGSFTPALMSSAGEWWITLLGMAVVTLVLQWLNYLWFRRGMGLDPTTAWFSGSPGGLMENIALGEAHGGDLRVISALQFLRIILVVITLPAAFSIWNGAPVGSSAGVQVPGPPLTATDGLLLVAALVLGQWGARRLSLPAGVVVGPLIVSAIAHATGLIGGQVPPALVSGAQWLIGTALGLRFAGMQRARLVQCLGGALVALGISAVAVAAIIAIVRPFIDIPISALLLSYIPGGVVEMGLIALSIGANPVFVTAHHVFRILIAVIITPQIFLRHVAGRGARTGVAK